MDQTINKSSLVSKILKVTKIFKKSPGTIVIQLECGHSILASERWCDQYMIFEGGYLSFNEEGEPTFKIEDPSAVEPADDNIPRETLGDGFEKRLTSLINEFSFENKSNTPDFILSKYLVKCLENFNSAEEARNQWCKS